MDGALDGVLGGNGGRPAAGCGTRAHPTTKRRHGRQEQFYNIIFGQFGIYDLYGNVGNKKPLPENSVSYQPPLN